MLKDGLLLEMANLALQEERRKERKMGSKQDQEQPKDEVTAPPQSRS